MPAAATIPRGRPSAAMGIAHMPSNGGFAGRPAGSGSPMGRMPHDRSRLPIQSVEWHTSRPGRSALDVRLGADSSGPTGTNGATGGGGSNAHVRLVGLHLSAGLSMRGERLRLIEVATLLRILGSGHSSDAVLVGDFNAIAPGDVPRTRQLPLWLRMLLRVDGGIRTDAMTQLFSAGWIDAYRHLQPDAAGFTLPPLDPSVRLDYMLVPTGLAARVRTCRPVEPSEVHGLVGRASDHLPLLAELDA